MTDEPFDKESVYDTEISPLMAKIIEICEREKIPLAATFVIKDDGPEQGPLLCTTILPGGFEADVINRVRAVVFQKPAFMAVTIRSDREATP